MCGGVGVWEGAVQEGCEGGGGLWGGGGGLQEGDEVCGGCVQSAG